MSVIDQVVFGLLLDRTQQRCGEIITGVKEEDPNGGLRWLLEPKLLLIIKR